jgi:succinyl-diaminopimelate desuccinylase
MIDDIVSVTETLIRYRTTHKEPGQIRSCAEFIERWLRDRGIACRRIEQAGVPSVVALPSPGHAPVLLMSHIDVVEGTEDLFTPRVENGCIYGRGSLDDKYAAALSMVLMARQQRRMGGSAQQAGAPLGILITGDEEAGGFNGAKRALEQVRADFCIALDGGSVEKIVTREKGLLKLRLVSRGRAAHGSRPWMGENAIEALIRDYTRIREVFGDTEPMAWHRTLNFSQVSGGGSFNQVPDRAEAVFDVRYTEADDPDELIRSLRAAVSGELLVEAKEPLFISGASPYLDRLLAVAKDTTVGFEHGASDARFLSDFGIPGIVWGADGDKSAHAPDEHVRIDSIVGLADHLTTFLDGLAEGVPASPAAAPP